LSDTFSDVDRSRDIAGAIAWQERINEWPQTRAYKARSYELCGTDTPMLEVGMGSGVDAAALGAFGCDRSLAMCEAARARDVRVCGADVGALPYADNTFAAVRADRVIQHVDDPVAAIGEMLRACRPGGRVVVCDPDQESLVIEVPGMRAELVERVKRLRRDIGYRNGTFVRRLPALFANAGAHDITIEAFPLVLTDPDDAFGLPGWARYWSEHFSESETDEWEAGVNAAREAGFVYALLYFVIAACPE
jgi:ubiquinone/menaquinone biosynthesis C-methylase UbiE